MACSKKFEKKTVRLFLRVSFENEKANEFWDIASKKRGQQAVSRQFQLAQSRNFNLIFLESVPLPALLGEKVVRNHIFSGKNCHHIGENTSPLPEWKNDTKSQRNC